GRYRSVPEQCRRLARFRVGPDLWERLGIPVRLAFFFENSDLGRDVAFYPSPAGATEAEIAAETWREVRAQNAELTALVPDVEAALVRERAPGDAECFVVPIDECYALTGIVRRHWRGFGGGDAVWSEIDAFFERLCRESASAAPGIGAAP